MSSPPDSQATPTKSPSSRTSGRPTKEETLQLSQDLQEAALNRFLQDGYEGTSLEAIAHAAGTTKASLYTRFANKEAVFESAVRWALERSDWPVPPSQEVDPDDLAGALRSISAAALRRATHPSMVGLTRVVVAQAVRFPDLAQRTLAAGWMSKEEVVSLLQRHAADGAIVVDEPEILAEHFLGLVSGMPAHVALLGLVRGTESQQRHTEVAVDLFLRGLRPH